MSCALHKHMHLLLAAYTASMYILQDLKKLLIASCKRDSLSPGYRHLWLQQALSMRTCSAPKMSSSATRPPMQTSMCAVICCRVLLYSSFSGVCRHMHMSTQTYAGARTLSSREVPHNEGAPPSTAANLEPRSSECRESSVLRQHVPAGTA